MKIQKNVEGYMALPAALLSVDANALRAHDAVVGQLNVQLTVSRVTEFNGTNGSAGGYVGVDRERSVTPIATKQLVGIPAGVPPRGSPPR